MKPTSTHNDSAKSFPLIDCHYHSVPLDGCTGPKVRLPSIRNVSRDYFDKEAHRGFATDAALFGAMAVTTLVPIVSGVFAIIHLCQSITF